MHKSKILSTEFVTHDVKRFVVEKPKGYKFTPGQATEVAINLPSWKDQKRPFTFTSLNENPNLEFIIKSYPTKKYPKHNGMTEKIHTLDAGDELLIDSPWGTIEYKGPGVFVAGGAGITPFIAIFRELKNKNKLKDNTLIFSNKEAREIILEKELMASFPTGNLFLTLTREKVKNYLHERVNMDFMEKYVGTYKQNFYVCGPRPMVTEISDTLESLGVKTDSIVFEK